MNSIGPGKSRFFVGLFIFALLQVALAQAPQSAVKSFTVRTEPNAIVWLDEVRRGVTDEKGEIAIAAKPGRHVLRVRAQGYQEATRPLLALPPGVLAVRLVTTTDSAELVFQQAEAARDKAQTTEERQKAAASYRRALQLRAKFPEANLGLARVLADLGQSDDALEQIERARAGRRNYAEASVVEGRIYRAKGGEEETVAAFQRALQEARGYQPEAHAGLALLYQEKGQYEDAATEFELALAQLYDSEPLLYQLLGEVYEKLERYREAIRVYEKFLQLAPKDVIAPAIRSTINQLRRQIAEQASPPPGA